MLKFKNDVIVVLKDLFRMVLSQFNATIQVVRSDNGGEFVNIGMQELFKHLGIIHQRTCTYTPSAKWSGIKEASTSP